MTYEVPSAVLDPNHCISDLYYKKARYKVYWGGRGALKTWGFAEALVRKAAATPLLILCCREFQNSIKQSVHKVLVKTIHRLGLSSWFTITKTSITSRVGAEFMFEGLHGKEQTLRSAEDIDIVWVVEAQSVSEPSWRSLLPTIRKPGSEVWIEFNMMEENDATYQLFVANPRPRSIIHKINYDSNPWFPDELREEMEHDRATDYDLYEHVWLGMPRKKSKAIILSGKYRVADFPDDLWKRADRLFFGNDHGFAQDPATLIRSFILTPDQDPDGKYRLYIEYEAYGTGIELDELPDFFRQVPGAEEWPIKSDNSRPETISHLANKGFMISAAEKWPGSVEDGIAHLRKFDEIVIHTRCVKTAEEAYLWRYKVDKKVVDEKGQPQVLPVVVDKHNHCWDAVRYSLDGHITKGGNLGLWERLGN